MAKLKKICPFCNKVFEVYPSRYDRIKCCSLECGKAYQRLKNQKYCLDCGKILADKRSKRCWKCANKARQIRPRKCKGCGCPPPDARGFRGKYGMCRSCGMKRYGEEIKDKNWLTLTCETCGKQYRFPPSQILNHTFCSRKCCTEWIKKRAQVRVKCHWCKKEFTRKKSLLKYDHVFCSQRCRTSWHSVYLSGENHHSWKGGTYKYYGPNWLKQRRLARKRANYHCELCKISSKKLGQKLDVHHITAFREFGYIPEKNDNYIKANDLENLVAVCRVCHAHLEWKNIVIKSRSDLSHLYRFYIQLTFEVEL